MTLLLLAFIAGLLTVLAPCILPLIPVILGGSLHGAGVGRSNTRAFVIVASLAFSLVVFTFALKVSTVFIAVPEQFWKSLSGGIIVFFGLVYLFPALWAHIPFVGKMYERSNASLGEGMRKKSMWGDVLVGAALGPVFATCSPTYFLVLATILPVNLFLGTVYIVTYTIGLCFSLLLIALVGGRIVARLGVAANPNGTFKRLLGLIFVVVGLSVLLGYDKKLERAIVDKEWFDVTTVELKLLKLLNESEKKKMVEPTEVFSSIEVLRAAETVLETVSTQEAESQSEFATSGTPREIAPTEPPVIVSKILEIKPRSVVTQEEKAKRFARAPEIVGASGYVNTGGAPVRISDYTGKSVVLVEFWTYSCINCQHVLPHTTKLYSTYKDKGLVVIGIHTPEFAFEHLQKNVETAAKKFGVEYPVVLDNDYATWGAFQNRYWPRKYLIDIDGFVVYDHIGEGAYAQTETRIQEALLERALRMGGGENVVIR